MIVKQFKTTIPKMFIVNAVAGMVMLGTAAYAVRTVLFPAAIPVCAERYGTPTIFGMRKSDGALLAAGDLQSRLAGRDWGVLENLEVLRLKQGPAEVALKIALPDKAVRPGDRTGTTSGVGFPWLPGKLSGATSACLGYDVFVPENFDFGTGGALPGLMGGSSEIGEAGDKKGPVFATPVRWRENGGLEVRAKTAFHRDGGGGIAIDPNWTKMPRGQWMRLEQEVVLNTPGANDGILRVWIDGELKLENMSMSYRGDDKTSFRGVHVNVHYGDSGLGWMVAPKATSLWMTPFELRWR